MPPNTSVSFDSLSELVSQLPPPFIIMGDFNAHSPLWGNHTTNNKGKLVEKLLDHFNLSFFNTKQHKTHIHLPTGHLSSIDLAFCSPSIYLDFDWDVLLDSYSSDHFPIKLTSNINPPNEHAPRYLFQKADWQSFKLSSLDLTKTNYSTMHDPISFFSESLITVMNKTIPKSSSTSPKKALKPWFNDLCKAAIAERKRALERFYKYPTPERLADFKKLRAKARRTLKEEKRKCWQEFVSSINSRTSLKSAWSKMRKIEGKYAQNAASHLQIDGAEITSKPDITNALAKALHDKSSGDLYDDDFLQIKRTEENIDLDFNIHDNSDYNVDITMHELKNAIFRSGNTSAGPDEIHYCVIKNLPDVVLQTLLEIFNQIWSNGSFPDMWREAHVVCIPKPGKDPSNPLNYRPISLTNCLCKIFERIVVARLMYHIENNQLISNVQSGFRKGRSTTDHLVTLESFIREAFISKSHVLSVFFDVEAAYDRCWKYGVLRDLHRLGIRGKLPIFISNFLKNRSFKVKNGATLSSSYIQEEGYPQGALISILLFIVQMDGLKRYLNVLDRNTLTHLYVDDLAISVRAKSQETAEKKLQLLINQANNWASENGMKFSATKTVCVLFSQRRGITPDPVLKLGNDTISVAKEVKFLGLIFDSSLSFIPHMKYLKNRCLKALNLIRVASARSLGSDRKFKLALYRALIRSKLDYGAIVYSSARPSYRKMLDTVVNQGLKLALNAFRTSPATSLHVEAGELPLELRHLQLSMNYYVKTCANESNPANSFFESNEYDDRFNRRPRSIRPLRDRISMHLHHAQIDTSILLNQQHPLAPPPPQDPLQPEPTVPPPPWLLNLPKIDLSLAKYNKKLSNPDDIRSSFLLAKELYPDAKFLFTDGSKMDGKTSSALYFDDVTYGIRITNMASIFTAEIRAIKLALTRLQRFRDERKYVICCDSLSVLQSLEKGLLHNPLIVEILYLYNALRTYDITFMWTPSHVGISGNERADTTAKNALQNDEIYDVLLPHSDLRPIIRNYVTDLWRSDWSTQDHNKLHRIGAQVNDIRPTQANLRDETVLTRLRIGHSYITHSYLLRGEPAPRCTLCNCTYSIRHILLACVHINHIRARYYRTNSLNHLFTKIPPSRIFGFLRELGIYDKI